MNTSESIYGTTPEGKKIKGFTIENSRGLSMSAISYGATLTAVRLPDARGKTENIILGFDTLAQYIEHVSMFCGPIAGRFANRIAEGRFLLDGKEYTLACNEVHGAGPNVIRIHLHGGMVGFNRMAWDAMLVAEKERAGIQFTYTSRDGEEGYPGNLKCKVVYTLTEGNELSFEYWATTDKPTPVNLTNHAYWNLAGGGSGQALGQEISFNCPWYLPVDKGLVPTGEVRPVRDSPMDFTTAKQIGRDIGQVQGGYDHCFVIQKPAGLLGLACTARDPVSGRSMEVLTTKPGIQFNTGNFLDGKPFPKHGAYCLETQHFPNCVNIGHFPSCILRPGETYHHLTVHRFSA
jgi:aldose 1-epimerase